jgi:hypothetical protein
MNHLQPRDRLLQLQYLQVLGHELPLVPTVAGVRPHLLRDQRRDAPQHLLVLRRPRRDSWLRDAGHGGARGEELEGVGLRRRRRAQERVGRGAAAAAVVVVVVVEEEEAAAAAAEVGEARGRHGDGGGGY